MPSDAPVYESLLSHTPKINQQLARYGVKFGLYKNGEFNERLFPFDAIPRVIKKDVWATLERGLAQRVDALNAYLADVYGAKRIIRDGVVPEDFAFASSGYLPQCEGIVPPGGIHSHISGIDLVEGEGDEWFVLEDNLRIPSGLLTRSWRASSAAAATPRPSAERPSQTTATTASACAASSTT